MHGHTKNQPKIFIDCDGLQSRTTEQTLLVDTCFGHASEAVDVHHLTDWCAVPTTRRQRTQEVTNQFQSTLIEVSTVSRVHEFVASRRTRSLREQWCGRYIVIMSTPTCSLRHWPSCVHRGLTAAHVDSNDQSADDSCPEPGDNVKTATWTRTFNMFLNRVATKSCSFCPCESSNGLKLGYLERAETAETPVEEVKFLLWTASKGSRSNICFYRPRRSKKTWQVAFGGGCAAT